MQEQCTVCLHGNFHKGFIFTNTLSRRNCLQNKIGLQYRFRLLPIWFVDVHVAILHLPMHVVQQKMISVDNFFIYLRLLFLALLLLFVT